MKILKYTKKKNGLYKLMLDNGKSIDLYENVILDNDLLLTKEINDFDKVLRDNSFYVCYFDAIKMINTRLRSEKEVRDRLNSRDYSSHNVEKTISLLLKQGYINDKTFANSYVNDAIITTYHGPRKIRSDLKKKGVSDNLIDDALKQYDGDVQEEKCDKIINSIINRSKGYGKRYIVNKIYSSLLREGFDRNIIDDSVSKISFKDNKEIYDKEYNKAYNRLSKKYEGKELELKIRESLYRKGF